MKAATAARKLGIYLPATPAEFQAGTVTRSQFVELLAHPPQWLADLRRDGPHPRQVVAQKLGVSVSGLQRAGAPDVMTTDEITALLEQMPAWLSAERATQARVHEENARVKAERAAKDRERRGSGGGGV